MSPDRNRVLSALVAQLRAEHAAAVSAALVARDEATGEESKAENQYDTRAIEAGYLAGAQSRRVEALALAVSHYETALRQPGSNAIRVRVAEVSDQRGRRSMFLLGPSAAGTSLDVDGVLVRVVSPASPVGHQLAEVEPGDELVVGSEQLVVREVS